MPRVQPNAIAAVAAPFGRDLETAFARIERTVRDARARGVRLVVFPESTLGGYLREPGPGGGSPELPPALQPDGPEIERLIRIAGDTVVCAGYSEAGANGRHSSAVCVTGDGVLGRHRKVHLPPAERFAYTAGSSFVAFDTPAGRVGMLLCYDKLFPEAARRLAADGAQIVASMAAWPLDRHQRSRIASRDRQALHFDVSDRMRAIENQLVWVSSNQTGRWGRLRFLGRAKVVDPDGRVLAVTGLRGGVAVARVDAAEAIAASRAFIDHLADRRPATYLDGAGAAARGVRHRPSRVATSRMCGIVAEHGSSDPEALERMLERLAHRGPDDRGAIGVGGAWLGHRRLSIVDVSGGRQPLTTEDEQLWLVGNGEVYNHEAIRERRLNGRELLTDSDNEVALHLVDRHGPEALAELNGMFAFVMAGTDGRFVAARDAIGIKPLYWARRDGITRFASEMHVFDEDWQPLVEPFPPGCHWTPGGGLQRFAHPIPERPEVLAGPAQPGGPIPAELLDGTRAVLVDAVERQLMGDVPVGVFLSGGLDSSLVAAIAAPWCRARGRTLQTFAVGTEGSPDLAAAREVAAFVGSEHHERTYTAADALEALPTVVRSIESFDPGLVRSAVPNFLLARFTAEHVKVVLTGEGADELFAGYAYMSEITDADDLHDELERTVRGLHNLNLQRCDRVTMAHGLEARVPFLDREVIAWALRLPPEAKLSGPGQPEKRLLREAFAGRLPEDLLWRTKAEFGDGSGARDALSVAIEAEISDAELAQERDAVEPPLRTKEELAYYRIFREHLVGMRAESAISRFATA